METRRGRDEHGLTGDRHRAQVVRVQAGGRELPGVAAVDAQAEALGGGEEHVSRARGMGQHLVDVGLDVDRRGPRHATVARAHDTADVDVDVEGAITRGRERPDVGRVTPRRIPGLAPLDGLERLDAREPAGGQPPQMRLLGADQRPQARGRDARGRRPFDRGARHPGAVPALPERGAVHDAPDPRTVERERRHGAAGQRLHRRRHVAGKLPEAPAGAHEDSRRHAQMILSATSAS